MTEKEKVVRLKMDLPEGWSILVQESKAWLPKGIFCFTTPKGRVYCKISKLEDLLKGIVFEVLSPKECKDLNIEESYNEALYKEHVYTVEESSGEGKSQAEIKKETEEWMKKQKEGKGVEIHIHGGKSKQNGKEGDFATEFGKTMLQNLERNCIKHDVEFTEPKTIDDVLALKEALETAKEAIERESSSNSEKKGAAGQIPLSMQSGKGAAKGEYESYKSMIKDLYRKAKASPDKQVRAESKAILDDLWFKLARAQEKLGKGSFVYTEGEEPSRKTHKEPEIVVGKQSDNEKGLIEELNEEFRKREKMKREGSK